MHEPLSARQAEIAALVASGSTNADIARSLSLSPRTVESHIAAIFDKFGVRTRAGIALAMQANESVDDPIEPLGTEDLIGRNADVCAIAGLVRRRRLVTIVGTGGIGKTRTALAVASSVRSDFAHGVCLVDLTALDATDSPATALARALDLPSHDADPMTSLLRELVGKKCLLILDGCDHVLERAGRLCSAILANSHEIAVLTTSRERMRLPAETVYRLQPLGRASEAALDLFMARARLANERFSIANEDRPVIEELCHRLDGMPLAIELAAARSDRFTPGELLAQVDRRLALFCDGRPGRPARHRNIRSLIDWSFDRLDHAERSLLQRLSAFSGSFDIGSAVDAFTQCGAMDVDVVAPLQSLVEKSLVEVDHIGLSVRYRLLESVRIYAGEKFEERRTSD